jgi:hypothetical protein
MGAAKLIRFADTPKRFDFLVIGFLLRIIAFTNGRRWADSLAQEVQGLQKNYTLYFNRKYKLVGHLFHGRYKDILCDRTPTCWSYSVKFT